MFSIVLTFSYSEPVLVAKMWLPCRARQRFRAAEILARSFWIAAFTDVLNGVTRGNVGRVYKCAFNAVAAASRWCFRAIYFHDDYW